MRNTHIGNVRFTFGPWSLSRGRSGMWTISHGGRIGAFAYEPTLRRCLWEYADLAVRLLVWGRNAVWGPVSGADDREMCAKNTRHPESRVTKPPAYRWPEYPGPHHCAACGWDTCPDCMRKGMDCGVCLHETDPITEIRLDTPHP